MKPTAVPFTALLDGTDTGYYDMAVFGFQWSIDGGRSTCSAATSSRRRASTRCGTATRITMPWPRPPTRSSIGEADRDADRGVQPRQRRAAAGYLVFPAEHQRQPQTLHNYLPNGYSHLWGISFYWTRSSRIEDPIGPAGSVWIEGRPVTASPRKSSTLGPSGNACEQRGSQRVDIAATTRPLYPHLSGSSQCPVSHRRLIGMVPCSWGFLSLCMPC